MEIMSLPYSLLVDVDLGALTASEYNLIMKTLRSVAKNGEVKAPDVPPRLIKRQNPYPNPVAPSGERWRFI